MARVLVVDDDQVVRVLLKQTLEADGHQVSFACDGMQAVKAFRADPFEIVIMDLAMPNRSGLWAINQIKGEFDWAKIIANSGQDAMHLPKAEELGACEVLTKPLVPREVQDTVHWTLCLPATRQGR